MITSFMQQAPEEEEEALRARRKNQGTPNHQLLKAVLDLMPHVSKMAAQKSNKDLMEFLNDIHPLLFPLLRWILSSNRAHIRKLEKEEIFDEIHSKFQFMLLTSSPAREKLFQARKKAAAKKNGTGSFYMFHGSPIGNWHSILHMGLQFSGKPGLGRSGQAIWCANNFTTSVGYCQAYNNPTAWANSSFGESIHCMAILEVVNEPDNGATPGSAVCVVKDTAIIATRYFLVFQGQIESSNAVASSFKVRETFQ